MLKQQHLDNIGLAGNPQLLQIPSLFQQQNIPLLSHKYHDLISSNKLSLEDIRRVAGSNIMLDTMFCIKPQPNQNMVLADEFWKMAANDSNEKGEKETHLDDVMEGWEGLLQEIVTAQNRKTPGWTFPGDMVDAMGSMLATLVNGPQYPHNDYLLASEADEGDELTFIMGLTCK